MPAPETPVPVTPPRSGRPGQPCADDQQDPLPFEQPTAEPSTPPTPPMPPTPPTVAAEVTSKVTAEVHEQATQVLWQALQHSGAQDAAHTALDTARRAARDHSDTVARQQKEQARRDRYTPLPSARAPADPRTDRAAPQRAARPPPAAAGTVGLHPHPRHRPAERTALDPRQAPGPDPQDRRPTPRTQPSTNPPASHRTRPRRGDGPRHTAGPRVPRRRGHAATPIPDRDARRPASVVDLADPRPAPGTRAAQAAARQASQGLLGSRPAPRQPSWHPPYEPPGRDTPGLSR